MSLFRVKYFFRVKRAQTIHSIVRHQKMRIRIKIFTLIAVALLVIAGCDGDDGATGPAGGAGPEGPEGPAGPGGSSGASILVAGDRTITSANDLRGLTYARVAPNAGKIYASGHVGTTNEDRQVVIARFHADGTPDTSFSSDGFVELEATPEEANNDETSLGIAELQSGDVVAIAHAADTGGGQSVYLFRLTPDGTQVDGWGDAEGKVEVVFGWANADNADYPGAPATLPSDTAWDLQVDRSVAGDRVVVFGLGSAADGVRTDNDRYVARLNITETGAEADTTFNAGSAFSFHSTGVLGDNARRGNVEADGKIMSAGYTDLGEGLDNHIILIRLNADGTLDNAFGGFSSAPEVLAATPGIAVFNPFVVDGGYAECYAAGYQEGTASYVTVGYGAATADETVSTLGYETTLQQDIVSFRVSSGTASDVDTSFGNTGHQAIQSEGLGFPTNEDRGRHLVILPDDRTLIVGRFGGNPAAIVLTEDGQPDAQVFGDGVIELPHDTISAQFFGVALSEDGNRVAMTTNQDANGARLVVLKIATND